MAITYRLELNSKPKKDNTHLILLTITQNNRRTKLSTGVFVPKVDFNTSAKPMKWIRKSNLSDKTLNQTLYNFIKEAQDMENNLTKKDLNSNPVNIITNLKNKADSGSFISYYQSKLKQIETTKSVSYHKHLKSKLNNLIEYNGSLQFNEITVKFLNDYKAYLSNRNIKKKKNLNENSVTSNIRAIRTILYLAMSEEVYQGTNPFFTFRLKEIKANKQKLTIEEIKTIEGLKLKVNSSLWHVRNYFLFAFYGGGIRIGDIMQLKWNNIKEDRISFVMDKTDESQSTVLLPQAKKILKLYMKADSKPNEYIFPILDSKLIKADKKVLNNQISSKNAMINKHLKSIQDEAEINGNLVFHMSRHSFADFMRTQGASIYDIKNLLGHSDIKVTQKYLKGFDNATSDKAISDAFKTV